MKRYKYISDNYNLFNNTNKPAITLVTGGLRGDKISLVIKLVKTALRNNQRLE